MPSFVHSTDNAFDYIDSDDENEVLKWYCPPPRVTLPPTAPTTTESGRDDKTKNDNEDDTDDASRRRGWWTVVPSSSERKEEETGGGGTTESFSSSSSSKATTAIAPTTKLYLAPPAKRDFWRKTYYEPLLVKDDAPFLFQAIDVTDSPPTPGGGGKSQGTSLPPFTIETSFTIHNSKSQFDQAGVMVRIDHEHWIKAGIEMVDNVPRLSCVVTNGFSDWSTQVWDKQQPGKLMPEIRIRVHVLPQHGGSVVVEAAEKQPPSTTTSTTNTTSKSTSEDDDKSWSFIRIAHLNQNMNHDLLNDHPTTKDALLVNQGEQRQEASENSDSSSSSSRMMVGVFGACPVDQTGMYVVFDYLSIRQGSAFTHDAN